MKTLRNKQEEIQRLCKPLSQDQAVVFCLDASLRCLDADAVSVEADSIEVLKYILEGEK